jgi:hypothetical protein
VFEAVTATIDAIAAKLPGCGQVHHNVGADLIYCDGGRTALVAGGPPGIITLEVYAPSRAAEILDRELGRGGSPHAPRALTKVFLIAADGTPEAKEAKGGAVVGCGDALVGVRIDTAAGTETDRLKVALETLFAADVKAPYSTAMKKNTMKVVRVAKDERGVFEVELAGRPAFGGTCDVPRFKGQVEQTAAQFGKAAIKLNGSEKDWRCAGDVSDSCK